jgi:hypothetical protein
MAKAQGVKVGILSGGVGTNALASGAPPTTEEPKGFKKSGWATVNSTQVQQTGDGSSRKSGWATVSSSAATPSSLMETTPQRRPNHGFRTAGFETLETTSIPRMPKVDDSSNIVSGADDVSNPSLQSESQWSTAPIALPPPPPSSAAPPPPATTLSPPPPPSALPPPPRWLPRPPSPPGLPPRNDRMSSSFREPSPGRYMRIDRAPSPRSFHHRPVTPPRPGDDQHNRDWQGHPRYRGSQGYR